MSFFFNRVGRSRTNAVELARQTADLLTRLAMPSSASPKMDESLPKCLSQMKAILQGTADGEPSSAEQIYQLVHGIIDEQVLCLLPQVLHLLPFESRKDAQVIFSSVFRHKDPQQQLPLAQTQAQTSPYLQQQQQQPLPTAAAQQLLPPAVDFVTNRAPSVLVDLCRGYEHKESATTAGSILREVLKHEMAAAVVLYDDGGAGSRRREDGGDTTTSAGSSSNGSGSGGGGGSGGGSGFSPGASAGGVSKIVWNRVQSGYGIFWQFFQWIDTSSFEVAADAFTTFRELLTRHKELVARYLSINFDLFFSRYHATLVQSHSYVTKRQSIKLLGEILLDRANYSVMTRYVDSGDHLKICMNLLRDDRKMVQYEGFHVFKVFVANPHKSVAVQKILIMNRDKLISFLAHFLEERTEDEQFIDEREFLIKQIRAMPPKPVPPLR